MKDLSFDALKIKDKWILVNDFADELMSIEFYDHRIRLYSLNTLFIESYQNIETREMETIRTISREDLDKFLSQITIPSLLVRIKSNDAT
jgi:hypothetical protein